MKVYTLIEDSKPHHAGLVSEHGLCLYFEYGGKRILFDTGASDLFIYNATLLGIELPKVDICVLSHAYNDHTGGLKSFLDVNDRATVYMKNSAKGEYFIKHSSKLYNAGIDPRVFTDYPGRIEFINEDTEIADGVFAVIIDKHRHYPNFTSLMFKKQDGELEKDDLLHEMFVAVETKEGAVVLTGCSHQGVLNILMTANEKFGKIAGVIGGLHLDGKTRYGTAKKKESVAELNAIANYISENKIKNVYVGHCMSERSTERLELFARVHKIHPGDVIEI